MCNVKAPAEKIRLQARAWAKAWARAWTRAWVRAWARAWACQAQKCRAALEQYFGILKNCRKKSDGHDSYYVSKGLRYIYGL